MVEAIVARGGREGLNEALHAAVARRDRRMVEWLLTHGGTDVNVPNYEGKTPRQVAQERGYEEITNLLTVRA